MRWFGAAAFAIAVMPGSAMAKRLALVVGNADYQTIADLKNPASDASAMAEALKKLDFEVTLLTDVGSDAFWAELDGFTERAETADSTVFYYSGHAFQMSGVNYLVPVSARLESRQALTAETLNLYRIIARLQSRNRQTLVFLDACRNDPLPQSVRGAAGAGGLARVQTGVGTFVAFSTEPGGVAADAVGDAPHSPFTSALLTHIGTEGISVSDMTIEVRNEVEVATARKQVPWDQSSLRSQFYFVPPQEEGKQELSEQDYELMAQLSPEDRTKFLALLAQSGFDQTSLAEAEAAIAVAESNLVIVASQSSVIAAPETAPPEPPVVETAALDQTTSGGSAPAGDLPASPADLLAGLEVVASAVSIGDASAPIRLAALDFNTRDIALNAITVDRLRLRGRVLHPDSDADRAILAAIDPALVEEPPAGVEIEPAQLAAAVQGELKRVGCYQMKVDGSWGKGSRTALTSYFLAKRIVPDSLEPTQALYDRLQQETQVVCAARVAKSAVSTGKSAKAAAAEVRKVKADVRNPEAIKGRKADSRKPLETKKKKIEKSAIGMTGSF